MIYKNKVFRQFKAARSIAALILLAVGGMVGAPAQAANNQVRFGVPFWPDAEMQAEVAAQILQSIGYAPVIEHLNEQLVYRGLSTGDLDVFLSTWEPSMHSMVAPYYRNGSITKVGTSIPHALYDVTVPDYVYKAGVHSIADLNRFAGKFNRTIYGIEPGNDGNNIMKKAIKDNTYNLKGWNVVESSEAGMLSQVKKAVAVHQWVAFLGWKPHYMNIVFHINYLGDPKHIWGGESHVDTVVRTGFIKQSPNVTHFFRQLSFPTQDVSLLTYQFGYKKQNEVAVAKQYIKGHMNLVTSWLKGVKTADGRHQAADAVRAAFK